MKTTQRFRRGPMMCTLRREHENAWCSLEVNLENGRLSICGSEGRIQKRAKAKKEALAYWEELFKESAEGMERMRRDHGKRTPKSAARFVVESDGDLHGLDVAHEDGDRVYIVESCGQIQDTLAQWFPEAVPYFKWHLNDMHAECEHQEARGESWATHPSVKCRNCGYVLGSAWLKRELPPEVSAWVESLMPPKPSCVETMGCMCAGHARGNASESPCDTSEARS